MRKPLVLTVGLDDDTRKTLGLLLCGLYEVKDVGIIEDAVKELDSIAYDFLIIDVDFLRGDLTKVFDVIGQRKVADTRLIILSSEDSVKNAVYAIKHGADDYLVKPYAQALLLSRMEKFGSELRSKKELEFFKEELRSKIGDNYYISKNAVMKSIYRVVEQVAGSSSNVLITGENGTGKEMVARSIHYGSTRKERPFIAINCAAIPGDLMESEFFGHEKGAFTGAVAGKVGRMEYADGGSVFLDEISTLAMPLQAKLLRVVQEKAFTRVGSNKQISVDVRFIAATNADLAYEVREGRFREDLFYRLNVVPIHLPPLRERKEDVPLLAEFFAARHAVNSGYKLPKIAPSALEALMLYDWPGNIRELQNVLERVTVLSGGKPVIERDDLPYEISRSMAIVIGKKEEYSSLKNACSDFERGVIMAALESCVWNCALTARRLKIHRNTLLNKMREYGIKNPRRSFDEDDFDLRRAVSRINNKN